MQSQLALLLIVMLLNACGSLPAKRLFGLGGISSGGDRPGDEPKEDRQGDAAAGPVTSPAPAPSPMPAPEVAMPGALNCESNAVLAKARFVVDLSVNAVGTSCDATNARSRVECIIAITFGDADDAQIDYAEGTQSHRVSFTANKFKICGLRVGILLERALGVNETHEFQLAPDAGGLVHVQSGRVFAREGQPE